MTTLPQPRGISERILDPLRQVATRNRALRGMAGVLRFAVTTLSVWLIVALVLGRFPELPVVLRVILAAGAWGTLIGAVIGYLRPAFRRTGLSAAAAQVEQTLPELHERISSAVELAAEPNPAFRGSPELLAHLTRQAERDAQTIDPNAVVSARAVLHWAMLVMIVCFVWLAAVTLMPPTVLAGLSRTFAPWQAPPPAVIPELLVTPGNAQLGQGEPLTVEVEVVDPLGRELSGDAQMTARYPSGQTVNIPMDRLTTTHKYQKKFDNIQEPFTYQIAAAGTQSPTYRVDVLMRPAIAGLEIEYEFPKYTGLSKRTDKSRDGTIEAVVGTQAKLIVHASQPLMSRSRLVLFEGTPEQATLPLTALTTTTADYGATVPVNKSGTYRIELLSQITGREMTNADAGTARKIIAKPDTVPVVQITSPEPFLRIRPDDAAVVKFEAHDDFKVAGLEVTVQVDDRSPVNLPVPFVTDDPTKVAGAWTLNVAEQIRRAGATQARQITYQLKVTDNAEPKPQVGLSAKQLLRIETDAPSFAAQQDKAASKNLAEAIRQAREKLEEAQRKLDALRDPSKPTTAQDKETTAQVKRDLAATSKNLTEAAKQEPQAFEKTAQEARQVAENQIKTGADDVAKAELASDDAKARQQNLNNASKQVAEAREKLEQLSKDLEEATKDRSLARQLEDLAAKQKRLAEAMEKAVTPEEKQKLANEQRQLQRELEELIKKNPELQKPAEAGLQPKMNELAQKVQQLEEAQKPVAEQLQNKADAQQAAAKANELAKQQEKLNQDVQNFANQQQNAMKSAGASAPEKSQLDPIVKDLQASKLESAEQAQRTAASKLEQAAEKMEQAAQRSANAAERSKESAAQAEQNAAESKKLGQDVQQLGKDIQDARTPPTRPGDAPNQKARELAQGIQKQADQVAANSPAQRQAAAEAKQVAAEGSKAASQGQAQQAQQKLAEAAQKLQQAADNAVAQNPASHPGAGKQAAEATQQGRQLAERQKELAQKTGQLSKSLEEARNADPKATAERQQGLAQQIDKTAKDAQDLQKRAEGAAPEMAKRISRAAEAMQQAASDQRDAAKSTQAGKPQQAAKAQQASAEQLAKAEEALTGQSRPQAGKPPAAPDGNPGLSPKSSENAHQGDKNGQDARSGQADRGGQGEKSGQADKGGQGDKPGQGEKTAQSDRGGQGEQPGQGEKPGQGSADGQGEKPGQGTSSGVQGGQTGQGSTGGQGDKGSQGDRTAQGGAGSQGGKAGQGSSPSGQANGSSNTGGKPGQGAKGSGQGQAAQAVQQAHQAQGQAAGSGNASDARQAAQALEQASRQLGPASGAQPGGGSGAGNGSHGGKPGPNQGQASGHAGKPDGQPGTGGGGIKINPVPTVDMRPAAVKEVGISPSDWAKLPPLMQQQLLNAAQQKGPPGYQEQVKSYYQRIARMAAAEGKR